MILRPALFFLLLLPISSAAQFNPAFEIPQPQRIRFLDSIRHAHYSSIDPVAQIRVFTELKELAERHHDPQSGIYCKAHLASAEVMFDSSLLAEYTMTMRNLIDQAMRSGNQILQVHVLVIFVDDLRFYQRMGAALSYYILLDQILDQQDADVGPRAFYNLRHDLILHLYEIGDYHRAKEIMNKADDMPVHPEYALFYADLHSQILVQLQQYDSSAYFIAQAKKILDRDTNGIYSKGWYGILDGNLAKINYYKKEYALAIPLLEKAVAITYDAGLYDNTAPFGLLLADCYLRTNEHEKIKPLIPVIHRSVHLQNRDEHYIGLYKLLLVIPGQDISPERKMAFFDSIEIRKQSLALLHDRNLLTRKELEFELAAYQERQPLMDAEIKRQLMWRNLLWGALGTAVFVFLLIYYRRNKHFQSEQERSRLLQVQSEQELAASREQLNLFAATLQEKSRQIESLENNIDISQQSETLARLRQNTILTEEEWARFKSLFEKAYPGFFARAAEMFPNLTAGEMRFIALLKLAFTTKEMAATLGVSPVSVRSIRSRLLKKLDLAEHENLGQRVNSI